MQSKEKKISIRYLKLDEHEQWLRMRTALWPETHENQHRKEMAMMLADSDRFAVIVCEIAQGHLVGFAEVSLREWAEGCLSSPVGYLEGWYIEESHRKSGLGRKLLVASEDWVRSRGCKEMASDTDLGNLESEKAHLSLGFRVVARLTAFKKSL
jgi:aminoglycoside 6'-N-acetyltransferase I